MPSTTLLTLFLAAAAPAHAGPSFACVPGQGAVETAICASPDLAAADRQMAALYAVACLSAFGDGPSDELERQRKVLQDMQGCVKPVAGPTTATCLKRIYDARNDELALAAATRSPDLAFPVIRRIDPVFAPIAEAIAIWASEPEKIDWSAPAHAAKKARILALLKPILTDLLTREDESFARSILATPGDDGIAVTRIDDLLRSPGHFAAFLNAIGPTLDTGNGTVNASRVIPCAAIVGHPTLLKATASVYGSTMDSFVFNTDCSDTLPPVPALTALDAKLVKNWPQCDGTIRFAAYRTYAVAVDSARLGFTAHDPKRTPTRRKGIVAADIAAARSELAHYYQRHLGTSQAQAAAMAMDAVADILGDAQECD